MKKHEVRVGSVVLTKVGGVAVRVRVTRMVERTDRAGRRQVRYAVARVEDGRQLPKARTAAALHLPPRTFGQTLDAGVAAGDWELVRVTLRRALMRAGAGAVRAMAERHGVPAERIADVMPAA